MIVLASGLKCSEIWQILLMEGMEMHGEKITVDVDRLRNDLKNESLGAFYGGRFGGALAEAGDIEMAPAEELVKMAQQKDIDLGKYQV